MAAYLSTEEFPFEHVAVTGGTGTVGSVFTKVLLAQCPRIAAITTAHRTPNSERVKRLPASSKLHTMVGNTADPAIVGPMIDRADIVYHLAGWLANTDLPPDHNDVYITNSLSVALFGMLCARQGKRFVYTSSHSVYFAGEYAGRIREDTFAFREDFVDWMDQVRAEYYQLAEDLLAGRCVFESAPRALAAAHRRFPPPFEPKIYDNDGYHIYCLTKLLGEQFALDQGGVVLRLSNVYGPGDDSVQAVGEACQRILEAQPGEHIGILRPFKKLVPAYLGDIVKSLIRAGTIQLTGSTPPLFTVASQEHYLKEDGVLRTVAGGLNTVRGTQAEYDIEMLPADNPADFTYDLDKLCTHLLSGERLTPFQEGIEQHLRWLLSRSGDEMSIATALEVAFSQS